MQDPDVSHSGFWKKIYAAGDAGWDLGGPCPVFEHLLRSDLAPPRGRVAFPGCGTGHDVRLFLAAGYDAVGFDFAIEPKGIPFEHLDVFELGERHPAAFDVVVEYTCYCAIDPARRSEYAGALRAALKAGGRLIALLYPMEPRPDGPPFGIDEAEIDTVLGAGLELLHVETPASSVESRRGRERLVIFRKPG